MATSLIAGRLTAQLLAGAGANSPEAVARRLLAVQAQDPRGARLSVRSRSIGLAATDVDDALTNRRSLLVTWLNRGTLHLVAPEDYWWLHPLTTPQLATANRRRLSQEGVDAAEAARGVEVITEAVSSDGPQTRGQLRARLDAAGVPTDGQALVHVLVAASLQGRVIRGPMSGADHAYVAVDEWLGHRPEPIEHIDALARLALRYLAGHGPAEARDLAKWAGLPLREARRGLDLIAGESAHLPGGLVDLVDRDAPAQLPPPRLLGPFDPLLLGWVSRQPVVGAHTLVTTNGIFRPFALVDGRVVATWGLTSAALTVQLLEPVEPSAVQALRQDATEVLRFLGLPERRTVAIVA